MEKKKKMELLKRTAAVIVSLAMSLVMLGSMEMEVRAAQAIHYEVSLNDHNKLMLVIVGDATVTEVVIGETTIDIPDGSCFFKPGNTEVSRVYHFSGFDDVQAAGNDDADVNYNGVRSNTKWKITDYHVDTDTDNNPTKIEIWFTKVETTTPDPDPSPASSPSMGGQNHTHSFEWTVTKEPTKTQDGLEEYKCKSCGAVEASQPISANMFKVKELYGLVKDAPKGGAVAYDFGDLATISDYVLGKMAERNDVAVTVSFTYGGEEHSITFPAGTDYTAVLEDADAMYGFYGVAAKLGLTVE